jgi:MFS family permease
VTETSVREAAGSAATARTVVAAVGSTGLGVLPVWLLGGLAVQLGADLDFGESELGIAVAVYFTVSALASVPGGRLVERIGWVAGVGLTAGLSALAMLSVAVGAWSWQLLVVLLAIGAIGNGLSQPAANLGVARVVRAGRQGLAFGIKQAAMPITTLLVGLAVPLLGATLGWRWAFAVAGVLALGIVAVPPPTERASASQRPREEARPRAAAPMRSGDTPLKVLLLLALGAGFGTAATNSIGGFLVVYGASQGLGPEAAGGLLIFGSVVGIGVRVLVGYLADRIGRGHLVVCAGMMLGGGIGLALLAAGGTPLLLVVGTALAFGLGWSWNGLFAFAVVRANANAPAAATGIVQTTKYACGTIGPLAFGFTVERVSYAVAWGATAIVISLGAGLLLLGRVLLGRPVE